MGGEGFEPPKSRGQLVYSQSRLTTSLPTLKPLTGIEPRRTRMRSSTGQAVDQVQELRHLPRHLWSRWSRYAGRPLPCTDPRRGSGSGYSLPPHQASLRSAGTGQAWSSSARSRWPELNRRPTPYHGVALPAELQRLWADVPSVPKIAPCPACE